MQTIVRCFPSAHMQQHEGIPERLFVLIMILSQSTLGSPGNDLSMSPAINTLSTPTDNPLTISKDHKGVKAIHPSIHRNYVSMYVSVSMHLCFHPSTYNGIISEGLTFIFIWLIRYCLVCVDIFAQKDFIRYSGGNMDPSATEEHHALRFNIS